MERETDKKTVIQKDKQTERQTDRKRDRWKNRQTEWQTHLRQTHVKTDM